jgi:hypothetical protein
VSRWWLVELHEDLESRKTTRTGVWCGVHGVNGVKDITDMDAISYETLEELLRPSDPELLQLWRKQKRLLQPVKPEGD